jgi:hypothetical protein
MLRELSTYRIFAIKKCGQISMKEGCGVSVSCTFGYPWRILGILEVCLAQSLALLHPNAGSLKEINGRK